MTADDLRQIAVTLDKLADFQAGLLSGRDANGFGSGPVFVPESVGLRSVASLLSGERGGEETIIAEYDPRAGEFTVYLQ